MKKIILISSAVILLISTTLGIGYVRGFFDTGIKQCPEEWYENRMPSFQSTGNRQYLIVNGERRETDEFNMKWIQINCEVKKPSVVS